jgi:hypothetical protein
VIWPIGGLDGARYTKRESCVCPAWYVAGAAGAERTVHSTCTAEFRRAGEDRGSIPGPTQIKFRNRKSLLHKRPGPIYSLIHLSFWHPWNLSLGDKEKRHDE